LVRGWWLMIDSEDIGYDFILIYPLNHHYQASTHIDVIPVHAGIQ